MKYNNATKQCNLTHDNVIWFNEIITQVKTYFAWMLDSIFDGGIFCHPHHDTSDLSSANDFRHPWSCRTQKWKRTLKWRMKFDCKTPDTQNRSTRCRRLDHHWRHEERSDGICRRRGQGVHVGERGVRAGIGGPRDCDPGGRGALWGSRSTGELDLDLPASTDRPFVYFSFVALEDKCVVKI